MIQKKLSNVHCICGFSHIYWRNLNKKLHFLCRVTLLRCHRILARKACFDFHPRKEEAPHHPKLTICNFRWKGCSYYYVTTKTVIFDRIVFFKNFDSPQARRVNTNSNNNNNKVCLLLKTKTSSMQILTFY